MFFLNDDGYNWFGWVYDEASTGVCCWPGVVAWLLDEEELEELAPRDFRGAAAATAINGLITQSSYKNST